MGHNDMSDIGLTVTVTRSLIQVKPDLVYWTGDIMPHDVWENTREDNVRQFNNTLTLLKTYLPGVKVIPAMGNHEGVPVNSFPIPQIKGKCDRAASSSRVPRL